MINEQCWVLLGDIKYDLWWAYKFVPTEGEPCQVAFDPYYVLKQQDRLVGFYHTHPGMIAHPSSTDDATMRAWVTSLGKSLVCCIKGIDGLRAWWYLDDESPPVEYQVESLENIVFGLTPEGEQMSWFQQGKKKLEKQQKLDAANLSYREDEKRSDEEVAYCKRFTESHFADLINNDIKVKQNQNEITLSLKNKDLVKIRFYHEERKVYEDDTGGYGGMVGTGQYYIIGQMKFCQPHMDVWKIERKPWENYSYLNESSLLEYLTQFIN